MLLGLFAVATRARTPDPGPEALELPGDEPPAVVSMLTDDWAVGREAVPATPIDLAARKTLAIEPVGLDRFLVRLPSTATTPPDLAPYEDQVLDHVRSLAAADGTVPCEAFTTGPEAESKGWWSRFEKSVVADASDRGLSRSRWSRWMLVVLGATALVRAAALALVSLPPEDNATEENPAGAFIGATATGWLPLMALPRKLRAERRPRRARGGGHRGVARARRRRPRPVHPP